MKAYARVDGAPRAQRVVPRRAVRHLSAVPAAGAAPARVAVFRALQLGDMLCAVPALRALRRHWPHSRITLVGLGEGGEFARRFGRYIDEWLPFPGVAAFPEQPANEAALPAFYARARASRFDLALQMHGSGEQSNAIVDALGARRWAGFVPSARQAAPDRVPWPDDLPEPLRYLRLLKSLGIEAGEDTALELPLYDADHAEAEALCRAAGLSPARTVLVHPGARLASRRWPAGRFAQVAAALAAQGWQVGVTGTPDEAGLVREVADHVPEAVDLCGRTSLGGLAALVARCRLVVCNDTGISHVCAAVGARSVVVASGSDVRRWAPLDHARHVVLWKQVVCRPCSYAQCPIGHPCALGVDVEAVLARAWRHLMEEGA